MTQLFHKNDLVRIAKDLGPCMSHFTADCDAIVVGSYANRYRGGGDDEESDPSYTLILLPGFHETSWYNQSQLTLIKRLGESEVLIMRAEADRQKALESTLPWILENWNRMKSTNSISGSSVAALMKAVGITNPWGSQGEGITYYGNAYATMEALKPELESGNLGLLIDKIRSINPEFKP